MKFKYLCICNSSYWEKLTFSKLQFVSRSIFGELQLTHISLSFKISISRGMDKNSVRLFSIYISLLRYFKANWPSSNEKTSLNNVILNRNGISKLFLKVVSSTFLLVCFLYLEESTCETRKNVFHFTSKTINQELFHHIKPTAFAKVKGHFGNLKDKKKLFSFLR